MAISCHSSVGRLLEENSRGCKSAVMASWQLRQFATHVEESATAHITGALPPCSYFELTVRPPIRNSLVFSFR